MSENLIPAIEAQVAATLGAEWKKLTHVYRLEMNRFDGADKAYGVIPIGAVPINGQTKHVTRGQGVELLLTESYISESITDDELRAKVLNLCAQFEQIELDMMEQKAGGLAGVENVSPFSVENAIMVKDEKVILVQATFVVTYRMRY